MLRVVTAWQPVCYNKFCSFKFRYIKTYKKEIYIGSSFIGSGILVDMFYVIFRALYKHLGLGSNVRNTIHMARISSFVWYYDYGTRICKF